jgi:hypothetical protein
MLQYCSVKAAVNRMPPALMEQKVSMRTHTLFGVDN